LEGNIWIKIKYVLAYRKANVLRNKSDEFGSMAKFKANNKLIMEMERVRAAKRRWRNCKKIGAKRIA
jgi:hypothetical protein